MTTKKIGICAWKTGENSVGVTLSYILFAEQFGEVIMLMPNHEFRPDLDLLLLPGGVDCDPRTYGEKPSFMTQKPDIQKEYFDRVHLPKYINNQTPIYGICRGQQSVAIALGGKLIQHMYHETNKPDDPSKAVHKISIDTTNFPNYRDFCDNNVVMEVNSRHHQAVREKSLPDDLVVIARHNKDNHVEALAHRTLPIVTVQFHSEDLYEPEPFDFAYRTIMHLINTRTSILG